MGSRSHGFCYLKSYKDGDMERTNTAINDAKKKASKVAIATISFLVIMKLIASAYTGSVGIRADAFHSIIDLSGAIVGFIAIRFSAKPPDDRHAFGHGKAENIAGTFIGGLILFAAATIVYEAIKKVQTGASLELVTTGIFVTLAAVIINLIVSLYVLRVAKAADSLAIEATAKDLLADLYSSGAVLVGLVLVSFTGIDAFDPIVALVVAFLIARTAFHTIKKCVGGLMDSRLPETEEKIIRATILEHTGQLVGFHELRTRKSGSQRFVDLHLVVPRDLNVHKAHDLCDHLERDIKKRVNNTSVTIHVEPCDTECDPCSANCDSGGK